MKPPLYLFGVLLVFLLAVGGVAYAVLSATTPLPRKRRLGLAALVAGLALAGLYAAIPDLD